jgi:hypothetical protein
MIYIKKEQVKPVPTLLTTSSIIVNNLSLTIDSEGEFTIKTGGKWKGTVEEFTEHMKDLYLDLAERIKDNDEL